MAVGEKSRVNKSSITKAGLYSACFFPGELADLDSNDPSRLNAELASLRQVIQNLAEIPLCRGDKEIALKRLKALAKLKKAVKELIVKISVLKSGPESLDDILPEALEEAIRLIRENYSRNHGEGT